MLNDDPTPAHTGPDGPAGVQVQLLTAADLQDSLVAQFDYGTKRLNAVDLLLRAICWAHFGSDQLGPPPQLILPPSIKLAGVERFHMEALAEPAKTGFKRHLAMRFPTASPEQLPKAEDYVHFLVHG